MSRAVARARARQIREQLNGSGNEFTKGAFRQAVLAACADLAQTALEGLVDSAVDYVDEAFCRPPRQDQGELFAMQGDYALGDDRRVARRFAHLDHMETAVRIHDDNLQRNAAANQLMHQELETLRPFWTPGLAKAQAVAAYRAAQEEQ